MATPPAPVDPVPVGLQRLVAASGIGFAVLFLITILVSQDQTPDESAGAAAWQAFAADNEDNLRIGALTMLVAVYLFIVFLGFLRSVVGEAERAARGFTRGSYWVLAGGTVGITGMGIGVAIGAAAAGNPDAPGEVIEAVSDLGGAGFGLAAAGFAAMLIGVGVLNLSIRALPNWLGFVALLTGLCFLLQLGVLLSENEDNAFGVFFPLGFLGLFVFTIAASVTFLRGIGRVNAVR